MRCYDRIVVSEKIDVNKTRGSNECDICVIFFKKGFKFQTYVCNRCYNLLRMYMNLSDIYILNIKNVDYCCIVIGISKS